MRARRGSVSRRVPTHCCSSPSPPPTVCPIWNIIRTRRLTLSCTFANTGKSCFQVKEMPFRVAFAALRSVVLSVLQCEIVKVGLQNRLVSGARLTWRRDKTDCFAGNLHDFDVLQIQRKTANSCNMLHVNDIQNNRKNNKNRRKIIAHKTASDFRRFFRVKKVSYMPFSDQHLILFYPVFKIPLQ